MSARLMTIALVSVMITLIGGCASQDGETDGVDTDGKADVYGTEPDSEDRAAILAAIHADYLDPAVNGQANELVVLTMILAGDYSWVTATVQAVGGGEIDWTNSSFADDVAEGFFDGPSLQALLKVEEGQWSVVDAAIGPTDVWWDGLWFRYPISCGLFPEWDSCSPVMEPVRGTDTRTALTTAIHEQFLDADVHGQPNELVISWIRAGGGYAFVSATVQAVGGGEIDWSDSEYAQDVEDGFFDGPALTAFLQEGQEGWTVVGEAIGPTDVWWWGIWNQYDSVPCALFQVDRCNYDF